jgi:N-acetylmuramoyl-L-alanine amidase
MATSSSVTACWKSPRPRRNVGSAPPRLLSSRPVVQDTCVCGRLGSISRRDVLRYAATAPAAIVLSTLAATLSVPDARATSNIAGMIVFLDPGHNGANDSSINRQVTNGRGGTKECQTTGTTTDNGYPEHTFNWAVVLGI